MRIYIYTDIHICLCVCIYIYVRKHWGVVSSPLEIDSWMWSKWPPQTLSAIWILLMTKLPILSYPVLQRFPCKLCSLAQLSLPQCLRTPSWCHAPKVTSCDLQSIFLVTMLPWGDNVYAEDCDLRLTGQQSPDSYLLQPCLFVWFYTPCQIIQAVAKAGYTRMQEQC